MNMPNSQPGGESQILKLLQSLGGLPDPGKIFSELQRLNYNIEQIQPQLTLLANSLERIDRNDIQNLTAAINKVNLGDIMRVLNEFTALFTQIYQKLWGK